MSLTVGITASCSKNAVRVKTQVGVTNSGKPTNVHQPRPSSQLY